MNKVADIEASKQENLQYKIIDINQEHPPVFSKLDLFKKKATTLPVQIIFETFKDPFFFWFLFMVSIEFTSYSERISLKLNTLLPLVLIILLRISKAYFALKGQLKYEKHLNLEESTVSKGLFFTTKDNKSIKEGDILLVKKNESAPFDCLILSVEHDNNFLLVKVNDLDKSGMLEHKKAVKDTHILVADSGINIDELKKKIEYVKVLKPNMFYEKFSGELKLKGSPVVTLLKYENFITSGTEIVNCSWALCLVVFPISESKRWVGYDVWNNRFFPCFSLDLRRKHLFYMGFMLVLIVINCSLYRTDTAEESISEFVIQTFILYGNTLPVSYYLAEELIDLLNWFIYKSKKDSFRVYNCSALSKLGLIEYVLTEKTGVLTEDKIKIQCCLVNSTIYQEDLKEQYTEKEQDLESCRNIELSSRYNYLFFNNLKEEIEQENSISEKWIFLVSLLVCNYAKFSPLCEPISNFALLIGLEIRNISKKKIVIIYNLNEYHFTILAICDKESNELRHKVLIKDESSDIFYLVLKETPEKIKDIKKIDSDQNDYSKVHFFPFLSLCKSFYFYKVLSLDEVKGFIEEYSEAKKLKFNKAQRIAAVFESYNYDYRLLGILGYEYGVKEENIKCVRSLIEAGLKVWVSTSLTEESVLATGYKTGIIDENCEIVSFNSFNFPSEAIQAVRAALEKFVYKEHKNESRFSCIDNEGAEDSILVIKNSKNFHPLLHKIGYVRSDLKDFTKIENPNLDFVVSISGDFMKLAFESRELMSGLIILMFAGRSSLFNNVFSENKRRLVKILHENLAFLPKVLVVGCSNSTMKMMSEAFVGVKVDEILDRYSFYSDIKVKRFAKLEDLVIRKGYNIHMSFKIVQSLTTFKTICFYTVVFLYQHLAKFSASPIIDYDLIVVYDLLISFVYVLGMYFCFKEKSYEKMICRYSMNFLGNKKEVFTFMSNALLAVMHSILIVMFVDKAFRGIIDGQGRTEDYGEIGVVLFILVNLALFVQGFWYMNIWKKYVICLVVCVSLLVVIVSACFKGELSSYSYSGDNQGAQSVRFLVMFMIPLLFYILSYTWLYCLSSFRFTVKERIEEYSNKIQSLFVDKIKWKSDVSNQYLEFDKWRMEFTDPVIENEYQEIVLRGLKVYLRFYIFIYLVLAVIAFIFTKLGKKGFLNIGNYNIIYIVVDSVLLMVSLKAKDKHFKYIEIFCFLYMAVTSFVKPILNPYTSSLLRYPTFIIVFTLNLNTNWRYIIFKSVIFNLISFYTAIYETYTGEYDALPSILTNWLIIIIGITILILISTHSNQMNRRLEFNFIRQTSLEVNKSSKILNYLLPDFVKDFSEKGIQYVYEENSPVSILVCKIQNFEEIIKIYSPEELSNLLNDFYKKIDLLCESFGVCKIETIGKIYVACAGLKDSESSMDPSALKVSHARRAVEFAISIIKETKNFKLKTGSKISVKIGINSGSVTAAVFGYYKPQFSVIGETVKTAFKMASSLIEVDVAQITMKTFDMLGETKGLYFKDKVTEIDGVKTDTKIVFYPVMKRNFESIEDFFLSIPRRRQSMSTIVQHKTSESTNDSKIFFKKNVFLMNLEESSTLLNAFTKKLGKTRFSIFCKENEDEKKFKEEYSKETLKNQKIGLIISVILDGMLILTESMYVGFAVIHMSKARLGVIFIGEILMVLCLVNWKRCSKLRMFSYLLSLIYTAEHIGIFISSMLKIEYSLINYMYYSYKFFLLNFFSGTLFYKNLFFNLVFVFTWLTDFYLTYPDLQNAIYTIACIIVVIFSTFIEEKNLRKNIVLKKIFKEKLEKTKKFLLQILPPKTLHQLEQGLLGIEKIENVTLLYAEIDGFTDWAVLRSPKDVAEMLNQIFTRFDMQCVEFDVYKVHIIGHSYVVIGMPEENAKNPAEKAVNLVSFAWSLMDVISEINGKCEINLGLKVGIHTGEVIGGMVGSNVIKYDIYGPDVLILHKVKEIAVSCSVTVTEPTKNLIGDRFEYEHLGTVKISRLNTQLNVFTLNKADEEEQ